MKKVLDRVWGWMKTTAWFQVVILVGAIVAIVLAISPIANAIRNAQDDSKKPKYFMNNRLSYNELMDKIGYLDNENATENDEFAVMFVSDNGADTYEEGISSYENTEDAVHLYIVNTGVTNDNKSKYNADEDWYSYYQITNPMLSSLNAGANRVYTAWKESIQDTSNDEISQDATFETGESVPHNCIMWFRLDKHIDDDIKPLTHASNIVNGENDFNYHVAKVYMNFQGNGDNASTQYLDGLTRMFGTIADNTRETASVLPTNR